MVCFKPCNVTFCVKVIPLLVLGSAGAVLLPPAPREGQARGAVGHGGLVPHTQQGKGDQGVFDPPGASPSSVGPALNHSSFPPFVFYSNEFGCCLMQIDNDFIRKRPSHFSPVIGGKQEDA